jgi:hypothetical protein
LTPPKAPLKLPLIVGSPNFPDNSALEPRLMGNANVGGSFWEKFTHDPILNCWLVDDYLPIVAD